MMYAIYFQIVKKKEKHREIQQMTKEMGKIVTMVNLDK